MLFLINILPYAVTDKYLVRLCSKQLKISSSNKMLSEFSDGQNLSNFLRLFLVNLISDMSHNPMTNSMHTNTVSCFKKEEQQKGEGMDLNFEMINTTGQIFFKMQHTSNYSTTYKIPF
jgi:hypothetical protein